MQLILLGMHAGQLVVNYVMLVGSIRVHLQDVIEAKEGGHQLQRELARERRAV